MRSRNNNYSSQTQIKVSPKSLKDGPLDESYHPNQVQHALRQIGGHTNENFEIPPRYKKYLGESRRFSNNNNNYSQRGGWHEKNNSNRNQNQNHSNPNISQSPTPAINNNDYRHYKAEKQQKHGTPNLNEDTKATLTPTTKQASVSISKPKPKPTRNKNEYHNQGHHESETKWDNDRHQHQDNNKEKQIPKISRNDNGNNHPRNDNGNNHSYNSRQNQNQNRNQNQHQGRDRNRGRNEHNYDADVAKNDYHELEKWDHDEYNDKSNRDNYHRNSNSYHDRDRGYERNYGRSSSSRSNYDDYDRRSKRRVGGNRKDNYNHNRYEMRDRYNSYDVERDRDGFNNDSAKVCKFYNPYFKSGCKNIRCPYAHLKHDEFLIYCKFIRQQSDIDKFSQKKFDHALAYIKEKMPIKAFYIFRHLVQDYEYDAHCNFWLGRCYVLFENRTRDDRDCAIFYYQKAIALKPNNASFHAYYAEFMMDVGRMERKEIECYEYKQAKIHIVKALELRPSARYHLQYAKLLDEIEGEFVQAKKYYKLALETYSEDSRIRLNYARLLHKMGNLRAAKQEFGIIFHTLERGRQQYQSLNSQWLWPHFHYARLLVEMQYYESAKKEFELCIQIQEHHNNKYFSEIYYEFSQLLFTAFNDNDHAYYYINRAVSHAPQRKWYKKLLYTIQDAYYQRDNAKNTNGAQEKEHEHKDESQGEYEQEPEPNQHERTENPNTNTVENSHSNDTNQTPTSSGFGFGGQYKTTEIDHDSYGYNHRDGNQDEDDYGVHDEDQDADDCAASIGQFSSLSFGSYGNNNNYNNNSTNNNNHAFAGFSQKELKPKTPTNVFVDDINKDISNNANNNNIKNEVSLNIPTNPNPEIPEMETRFCATEFDRFISSDTLFGNELEKYCDKFEDEGVNDIRWLLNEDAMNDNFLQTKIKMNQQSIILWKKSVKMFRNQYNIYIQWLQRNNFKARYFSKFQVYGILNLESFFYYIKNREDVLYMIGDQNERDADIIWQSAQNQYEQTKNQL